MPWGRHEPPNGAPPKAMTHVSDCQHPFSFLGFPLQSHFKISCPDRAVLESTGRGHESTGPEPHASIHLVEMDVRLYFSDLETGVRTFITAGRRGENRLWLPEGQPGPRVDTGSRGH